MINKSFSSLVFREAFLYFNKNPFLEILFRGTQCGGFQFMVILELLMGYKLSCYGFFGLPCGPGMMSQWKSSGDPLPLETLRGGFPRGLRKIRLNKWQIQAKFSNYQIFHFFFSFFNIFLASIAGFTSYIALFTGPGGSPDNFR